jgi:hypothetical protein
MNKGKLFSIKGRGKGVRQIEYGKKENLRLSGIWPREFYDPTIWKNRTKIFIAFEWNGSTMK